MNVTTSLYLGDGRRRGALAAELELERILNRLNEGVLRGRFVRRWPCGRNLIFDFYFPEIGLALDISDERTLHPGRPAEIAKFPVIAVLITDAEVFGDSGALVKLLRTAWRRAKSRRQQPLRTTTGKAQSSPPVRRKPKQTTNAGGWTTIEQGERRMGDNVKKVYADEGIGGSREANRATRNQNLVDIKKRNRGV